MKPRPFKRLPGRGRRFMNSVTLWEAEDVLLMVESHYVSETYRRFHWSDIQAIVICKTPTGLIANIVLGAITLLFGLPILFTTGAAQIVLGIIAGLFLILFLFSFLRGPTCRCTLRTAVQTQELPSLNRLHTARKALERMRAHIEAAQPVSS
jgi:hypothetical protein